MSGDNDTQTAGRQDNEETEMSDSVVKVTMGLSSVDLKNVGIIAECARVNSKLHAVRTALALTRFIVDFLRDHPDSDLLLRSGNNFTRVVMPELEPQRDKI